MASRNSEPSDPEMDSFEIARPPPLHPETRLPSGSLVTIAYVKDVGKFFVFWDRERFNTISRDLSEKWRQCPPFLCRNYNDTLVIVPFKGSVYRGQVLKTDGDKVEVYLIDGGGTISVEIKDLREMPCPLKLVASTVMPVKLRGLPSSVPRELRKPLAQYANSLVKFKLIYEGSISEGVELIHKDGRSVNEIIMSSLETKAESSRFPSGCLITIEYEKNANDVFIQRCPKFHYEKLIRELTDKWPDCPPLRQPDGINEIVAVLFRDTVYRGQVLETDGDRVKVFLIDSGATVLVDAQQLREMPDWMKRVSPAVLEVKLRGIPTPRNNDVVSKVLKKYLKTPTKFKLIYDDISEGVELVFKDGKSLNEVINNLIQEPNNDEVGFIPAEGPQQDERNDTSNDGNNQPSDNESPISVWFYTALELQELLSDEEIRFPPDTSVSISFLRDAKHVFIRNYFAEYEHIYRELSDDWPKYPPFESLDSVDAVVAVRFRDKAHRGLVLSTNGTLFKVQLMDSGETICVRGNELRRIPIWMQRASPAAVPVALRYVPESCRSSIVQEALKKYEETEKRFIMIYDGSLAKGVELFYRDDITLNDTIKCLWEETKGSNPNREFIYTVDSLEPGLQKMYIMSFWRSNVAYCVRKTRRARIIFEDMPDELNNLRNKGPFLPEVNYLCAWFDGKSWHRVFCLRVSEKNGTADVYAVDWGLFYTLKISSLNWLPFDYHSIPFLAVKCYITGTDLETVSARPAAIGVVRPTNGKISYAFHVTKCFEKHQLQNFNSIEL